MKLKLYFPFLANLAAGFILLIAYFASSSHQGFWTSGIGSFFEIFYSLVLIANSALIPIYYDFLKRALWQGLLVSVICNSVYFALIALFWRGRFAAKEFLLILIVPLIVTLGIYFKRKVQK